MRPIGFLNNAVRTKQIFTVLARHGFANLLSRVDPNERWWSRLIPQPREQRNLWERIRMALEELGPTFIKMGQLMSMRPDILPHGLILELRKLQQSVTPIPFEEIRLVMEEELGRELDRIFSSFDNKPVASASLAQVYHAVLHDGREVAVKIQRPNLTRPVHVDLDLLAWFAEKLHQSVEGLRPYDLPAMVAEVREGMLRELDYRHEARNQRYFNVLNPHPEKVFAPCVIDELSGPRVLVMEWISGTAMSDLRFDQEEGRRLARAGAESLLDQILIRGFFHADPHGGNIFVVPDGRICLLDWGMAGNLTRRMRYGLADLVDAAFRQDVEQVVSIASTLASAVGPSDVRGVERDVMLVLRDNFNSELGRMDLGQVLLKLLFVFGQNGIRLTRDYSLMAKAVLSIEELARSLDPEFDFRAQGKPVIRRLMRERKNPRLALVEGRSLFRSLVSGVLEIPAMVRRVQQGDLQIKFRHEGLEDLDNAVDRASNRITLGLIIAALIGSSSLIITTQIRPYIFGYPALGIIGYLLSAIMGLGIAWNIIRRGGHR